MTDIIQPLIFWPAGITRPVSTAVAYASIPQEGNRYGIGPDSSIPTLEASLPNLTVVMPNGASLTLQRNNLEGPESINEMVDRSGNWEAYIEGDHNRWAYIFQSMSDTLTSHLVTDPNDLPVATPMDVVRNCWPTSMDAPYDVQIDFNRERTSVTAVMPNGATMTLTRKHVDGEDQGPYDEVGFSGDWDACLAGMPEVHGQLTMGALQMGVAAQRAGMARAAVSLH